MDIGERIRRRREELDMTQDELARAAFPRVMPLHCPSKCASKKAVGNRLFFWIGAYEYD